MNAANHANADNLVDSGGFKELREKLALANRILYAQNIVDGFGHISVRHPQQAGQFMLSCNRAPGMVQADDILTYDMNADLVLPSDKRSYLERFIHSEIYKVRPDVHSIVHSHSQSVIPFGVTGQRLRPVFHMAGFLGSGSALFDISESAGNTDMLIRDSRLGSALAQSLASHHCVLMRGHGSTTVAPSIELAVYRAIYAEVNAKLQMQAMQMRGLQMQEPGQPLKNEGIHFLNEQEAALAAASTEGQVQRAWDLWRGQIESS